MILKDDVKLEWKNLYMYELFMLGISDKIHQCFLSLSVVGFFSTALFVAVVHGVVCINIVFATWRVRHRA